MAIVPRQSLPDDLTSGMACPICGAAALRVAHLKSFPDYVLCGACKASFVVEESGNRVLYGNIPEAYPEARRLALRKWAALDQVEDVARTERPSAAPPAPRPSAPPAAPPRPAVSAGVPIPSEPVVDRDALLRAAASAAVPIPTEPEIERPPSRQVPLEPVEEPEEEIVEEEVLPAATDGEPPLGRLSRLMAGSSDQEASLDWAPSLVPDRTPPAAPPQPPRSEAPAPSPAAPRPAAASPIATKVAQPAAAPSAKPAAVPAAPPPGDPMPGQRYRVVVKGQPVTFPAQACAHCLRSPASSRLAVIASVPRGQGMGQRQAVRFSVPLCRDCYRRAAARSAEEGSARLQAHLYSALIALALLVLSLAVGLIDPAGGAAQAALFMVILLSLGYGIPLMVLLNRAGRFMPPEDARYVRTTLLIPDDIQGLEIPFEWRNQRYAEQFQQANQKVALGGVVPVKDRGFSQPPKA